MVLSIAISASTYLADEHVSQRDRVIGSSLERGQRRFGDRREPLSFDSAKLREISEKCFQRGAKLVFRFTSGARICEFCFRLGAKSGNGRFQVKHFTRRRLRIVLMVRSLIC